MPINSRTGRINFNHCHFLNALSGIRLISEKNTQELLGAQAIGGEGVAKRIDVLATTIWAGMTLNEIVWLDQTYGPPVAPVWDPVLVAAQVGMKRV